MKDRASSLAAARVAVTYVVFSILWILISDRLVELFVPEPQTRAIAQTVKGWFFVFISGGLLFWFLVDAFQKYAHLLRQDQQIEDRYRTLVSQASDGIFLMDQEGRLVDVNTSGCEMLGRDRQDLLGRMIRDFVDEAEREEVDIILSQLLKGETELSELILLHSGGSRIPVEMSARMLGDGTLQGIVRDITERYRSREAVRRQLDRLAALRKIDLSISSTLQLQHTLDILIEQVIEHLDVDAAAVLLYNTQTERLEFAAGQGFRTERIQETSLSLLNAFAGHVLQEGRALIVPDFSQVKTAFERVELIEEEGFAAYYGMPLIGKGEFKGILEIFHRSSLHRDAAWMDFLYALAGQAAIAIDNAELYESLQRSNEELARAYDATLAGWSRALELRDQETDGHSHRVTDLVLRLAKRMGIDENELIHIRRGTLLHDIGKMGVPDNILLKDGPLTPDEWQVMRRHPEYACRMLAPIRYLRPALDIPYSHHERWDGSGYPRGLREKEIPLPARIFSVVDVWDALRSDRPYRRAWSAERVRRYLKEQAGTHFDPQVVDTFLSMTNNE